LQDDLDEEDREEHEESAKVSRAAEYCGGLPDEFDSDVSETQNMILESYK